MKHKHLTGTFGAAAFAAIFILLFVIGFTVLHQIIDFLITCRLASIHANQINLK